MTDEVLHDSREDLECCEFPALGRQVGVTASTFPTPQGGTYVDVSYEVPTLNTASYGTALTFASDVEPEEADDEINEKIRKQTHIVIERINVQVKELTAHRDRLVQRLKDLEARH